MIKKKQAVVWEVASVWCIVVDQWWREDAKKVKITGYRTVSDEQAHQCIWNACTLPAAILPWGHEIHACGPLACCGCIQDGHWLILVSSQHLKGRGMIWELVIQLISIDESSSGYNIGHSESQHQHHLPDLLMLLLLHLWLVVWVVTIVHPKQEAIQWVVKEKGVNSAYVHGFIYLHMC